MDMQQMMQQMMHDPNMYQQMQQMMSQMQPPQAPQVAAAPAAAAPAADDVPEWVHEQCEAWVQAKRGKRFDQADEIRATLRNAGYDPDKIRPHVWESQEKKQQQQSSYEAKKQQQQNPYQASWNQQPSHQPESEIPQLEAPLQVGMIQKGAAPTMPQSAGHVGNVPDWVEKELDAWVDAKRNKDFAKADSLRQALRDEGFDPDKLRPHLWESGPPAHQKGQSKGKAPRIVPYQEQQIVPYQEQQASAAPASMEEETGEVPKWVDEALDSWVRAKRGKDYETADRLRGALRKNGYDPDILRPHTWEAGPPGSGPASAEEVMQDTVIFVAGLPRGIGEVAVRQIFDSYGNVEECRVFSTNAKVRYRLKEEAKWVAEVMNENIPEGLAEPIKVSFTPPAPEVRQKEPMDKGEKGCLGDKGKGKGKGKSRPGPYDAIQDIQAGRVFKKTKMCTFFEQNMCEKGANCTYAHGVEELGTAVSTDLAIAANAKHAKGGGKKGKDKGKDKGKGKGKGKAKW